MIRMHRFKAAVAAVLALFIVAGCATKETTKPAEQPAQQAPAAKPKLLTIASGSIAVNMDVHKVTDSPSFSILEHVNETLFTLTPTGEVKPNLALSFEGSADNKTYTIKLRQGVKFSDGTPFNAEAVKLNLERVLNPDTKASWRSLVALVTKVEAKDEHTVVLTMSQPMAPLQAHLGHGGVAIIAPSALAKGPEWLASNTIGTGPYMIKEYKKDQSVTLVKNPTYWGTKPAIDEVVYKAVKEDGPRLIEVESGTADVALRVPPTEVKRLQANKDLEVTTVPTVRVLFMMLNNQKPPFNDKRVRQAMNYAIDKDSIVTNLLAGAARVSDSAMAPEIFGYAKQTPYKRDVAKAKALLKEAGVAEGTKVTLHHPVGRYVQDAKIAEAIAAQLKEVGLNVELKPMEVTPYFDLTAKPLAENPTQISMLGWSTPTLDGDYALYNLFHSAQWPDNKGFNRSFFKNTEVDKLLDEARTTLDPAKRKAAYEKAQKIIWDEAPWIFLHTQAEVQAIRKGVTGFVVHPTERMIWAGADKK